MNYKKLIPSEHLARISVNVLEKHLLLYWDIQLDRIRNCTDRCLYLAEFLSRKLGLCILRLPLSDRDFNNNDDDGILNKRREHPLKPFMKSLHLPVVASSFETNQACQQQSKHINLTDIFTKPVVHITYT